MSHIFTPCIKAPLLPSEDQGPITPSKMVTPLLVGQSLDTRKLECLVALVVATVVYISMGKLLGTLTKVSPFGSQNL